MPNDADDEFWKDDEQTDKKRKQERQTGQRLPSPATEPEAPKAVRLTGVSEDLRTQVTASFSLSMTTVIIYLLAVASLAGFAYIGMIAAGVAMAVQFAVIAQLFSALVRIQNTLADVTVRLDSVQRNQRIVAERK